MQIKTVCLIFCAICLTAPYLTGAPQEATKPNQPTEPPSKALAKDPRLTTLDPKVREMVLKEADDAKPYCDENAALGGFYECDCFAQRVFDQRLKIGTDIETAGSATRAASGAFKIRFGTMLGDKDFNTGAIGQCASLSKTEAWGKKTASAMRGATESRSTCVGQQLAARFKKKPVASMTYIQNLLVEAMEACPGR